MSVCLRAGRVPEFDSVKCPVCGVGYSEADLGEAYLKCKYSVNAHFLALCKSCRNVLVMRFYYLNKGERVLVEIVIAVTSKEAVV